MARLPQLLQRPRAVLSTARSVVRFTFDEAESGPFASLPRKPKREVFTALVRWWRRHGSVGPDAIRFGVDRVGGPDPNDLVPYAVFKDVRDRTNRRLGGPDDFNYVCLLDDKFVFAQFVGSLGYPVPRNLAFLSSDGVEPLAPRRPPRPLDALWTGEWTWDGFCKPLAGRQGQGVFPLSVSGDGVRVGGEPVSADGLRSMLHGRSILQERVRQHPALAALHPSSLNTLRIVTVASDDGVRPLVVALRVGAGGQHVDNFAWGGFVMDTDLERGTVSGRALRKKGGSPVGRHPDTGVAFDGYPVPFLAESVEIVSQLHGDLYGFHTVGWDVAITPDGPSIIEGNDRWDGDVALVDSGVMPRYLAAVGEPAPYRHRWAQGLGSL